MTSKGLDYKLTASLESCPSETELMQSVNVTNTLLGRSLAMFRVGRPCAHTYIYMSVPGMKFGAVAGRGSDDSEMLMQCSLNAQTLE